MTWPAVTNVMEPPAALHSYKVHAPCTQYSDSGGGAFHRDGLSMAIRPGLGKIERAARVVTARAREREIERTRERILGTMLHNGGGGNSSGWSQCFLFLHLQVAAECCVRVVTRVNGVRQRGRVTASRVSNGGENMRAEVVFALNEARHSSTCPAAWGESPTRRWGFLACHDDTQKLSGGNSQVAAL